MSAISNSQNSVEFELDSREVMINGVRNWLCFPVAEKDGAISRLAR